MSAISSGKSSAARSYSCVSRLRRLRNSSHVDVAGRICSETAHVTTSLSAPAFTEHRVRVAEGAGQLILQLAESIDDRSSALCNRWIIRGHDSRLGQPVERPCKAGVDSREHAQLLGKQPLLLGE